MCGTDDDTTESPGVGHEVASPEEMAMVIRHHRRTAALQERQRAERAASPFRTARTSVGAVMLLPPSPAPVSYTESPARPTHPVDSSAGPAARASLPVPAAPLGEQRPAGSVPAAGPQPKRAATGRHGKRAPKPAAAASVEERRLVVYAPQPVPTAQPQASPPLQLTWTVVPGDQVPLFSKGEFERVVKQLGGRLLTTDDSDEDVTVYNLILPDGEKITHLARKKGPYTILMGTMTRRDAL